MALETLRVYRITSGDTTYPHYGNFGITHAGKIVIDDSDGFRDGEFGDFTHTGGSDQPDQNVTTSTVSGINVGDLVDVRYKYTFTGSDGSSGTAYFLATNGNANYGPLIVSDTELDPNVTYRFQQFNTDGAVNYDNLVVCFTAGTRIETARGQVPIEMLSPGDMVLTRDNGFQPLQWIGQRSVWITQKTAPIVFERGVLGNSGKLVVSPNHRMLIENSAARLYFGESEVLVSAKNLLQMNGVSQVSQGQVTYVHLLFEAHEVIYANGAPSESLYPGPQAMNALEENARSEVLDLFPELRFDPRHCGETARLCLKSYEATLLHKVMH